MEEPTIKIAREITNQIKKFLKACKDAVEVYILKIIKESRGTNLNLST